MQAMTASVPVEEFVYLRECKMPGWEGRYHHPAGSGTIGRIAAELVWGSRAVFLPKDRW